MNEPFSVKVEMQDARGVFQPGAPPTPVTISFDTNPGGAVLGGATTVTTVGGYATFTNLTVSKAGTGYKLKATAPGALATPGPSQPFAVTP